MEGGCWRRKEGLWWRSVYEAAQASMPWPICGIAVGRAKRRRKREWFFGLESVSSRAPDVGLCCGYEFAEDDEV